MPVLVPLQLYVRRGDLVFRDLMEWDLASATASTHIYTSEVRPCGTGHVDIGPAS